MTKLTSVALFTLVIAGATALFAQAPAAPAAAAPKVASTGGKSPHETTSAVIDGSRVILVYGRPFSKDPKTGEIRKIWGSLVPFGKRWRTGSDEATLLITQQPIVLGGVTVPAGAHSLSTFPAEDGSLKLAVNNQIGQWGIPGRDRPETDVYSEANDVVRVDMQKAPLEKSVDQFTMAVAKNPAGGGLIKLQWENLEYSVPFTVKKP